MAEEYTNNIRRISYTYGTAFVLALAKDCGVLTTLTSFDQPLTSHEIATKNRLKERYVREMMGALSAARIVHVSSNGAGENCYYIMEDEKPGLVDLSMIMLSFLPMFASTYDKLRDCFYESGPSGYHYDITAHKSCEDSTTYHMEGSIKAMLEHVPELQGKLEKGIDVIDFGAGSAITLAKLAVQFPNSKFTASDVDANVINKAKTRWASIPNMNFEIRDICSELEDKQKKVYDWVLSVNVIHDQPKPMKALKTLRESVKDGGIVIFIDPDMSMSGAHTETVGNPVAASFFALSMFLCIPASALTPDSDNLGACCGRQTLVDMANKARLSVRTVSSPPHTLFIATPVMK